MQLAITFDSVGDIIAVTQLAVHIKTALCETQSTTCEYHELIAELDLFHRTCLRVNSVTPLARQITNQRRYAHLYRELLSILNAIRHHIAHSEYHRAIQKGGSKNIKLDTWRELGWMVLKKEDVLHLKADLTNQRETILLLVTLYNSYVQEHSTPVWTYS